MSTAAFDRFVVEEQRKSQGTHDADPKAQKIEFLDSLDELYGRILNMLASYLTNGQVEVEYDEVILNEETIGSYEAKAMLIRIGTKTIRFQPVGMVQVAARGRVDVIGPFARTRLLRVDSRTKSINDLIWGPGYTEHVPQPDPATKIEWVWRLITRPPERKIVELSKNELLQMILEIANG